MLASKRLQAEVIGAVSGWLAAAMIAVGIASQGAGHAVVPRREAPLDRLMRFVEQAVGPNAKSCGQFLLREFGRAPASLSELREASACIERSRLEKTPAWIVIQLQGIDSWVAYGLLATRDGGVQAFSYDGDPSGGSGAAPRFSTTPCVVVRVSEDLAGWARIACDEP